MGIMARIIDETSVKMHDSYEMRGIIVAKKETTVR